MAINKYQSTIWFQGERTTSLTIPDVTTTTITYVNEIDPFNMFNAGTGVATLPVGGLWFFSFIWTFASDVANWNHAGIVNTTTGITVATLRTASGPYYNTVSGSLRCAAGNTITTSMYADTASGTTMSSARFNGHLVQEY